MHELSIALNILSTVQDYALENQVKEVKDIHVKIGKLQAVVPDSLEFMFNQVKEQFPAAKNAKIHMNFIDIKATCDICNETFTMEFLNLICPNDSSHSLRITQGNELLIESMDIEK